MQNKTTAFLTCAFFTVTMFVSTAQESMVYTSENSEFQEALSLYHNKQYQAAQAIFNSVSRTTDNKEIKADSDYYGASAAIRLNQLGADALMEDFVENNPTSTKKNQAFLNVADYYFEAGKYPYALKWYKKVVVNALPKSELERFYFNQGYVYYASGKTKDAQQNLNRVVNSETYGSQATYYLGYIEYQNDNYEGASERFDQITDQDVLKEKLSYYQADLNFKLGNFDKAIVLAKAQLPKSDRQEISELNKIIGESYFNLAQYENAIPYLQAYKGKRGKWSNTDYYLLGYSFYQQKEFDNAIQQFNKIISGQTAVAQNAYYHLAECYLKLNKKQEALNAFKNASEMEFSPEIKEDALLNYARLSYEIGNGYENVPSVLLRFINQYPKHASANEIQSLLVDSYITSRDFKGALTLLDENKKYASKSTYQQVAYYRGVELYLEGSFDAAIAAFSKAVDESAIATITGKSLFWRGEAYYALQQYANALSDYLKFETTKISGVDENQMVHYSIGYAYFKITEYANAIAYFKKYLAFNTGNKNAQNDAYLRLGDSYFVSSQYWPAIEAYDAALALNGLEQDYATFQKALSFGFVNRGQKKLATLESFSATFPKSTLNDDVLFELGNTYVKNNEPAQGVQAYTRLITQYPGSSFVPKALLRQGLVAYNANDNEGALAKFKTVVRDFANTQEAIQAVATAKLVYVDLGRVNEYADWVKDLDFVSVSDTELDNATFEAAEKQYLEGNTKQAILGYSNYVKRFSNGLHILKAHFNLAQLQFAAGEKTEALPHYEYIIAKPRNEYSEQALTRVCEWYLANTNYTTAIPYLQRLEMEAEIPQNKIYAQSNLMQGYFQLNDYAKVKQYAAKVLATPSIDDRIKSDAHVMQARAAIKTTDEDTAKKAYANVEKFATGITAAEALYFNAYFNTDAGAFEASNKSVQRLAKEYAAYKEWGGKGLVLMAKNFDGLGDAFQATYILESVKDNFTDFPEVVEEATLLLQQLKLKEAERNSSIAPNEN